MAKRKKPVTLDEVKAEYPWIGVLLDAQQKALRKSKTALMGARGVSCGGYCCVLSERWTGETDEEGREPLCAVHRDIALALGLIEATEPYDTKP